MHVPVARKLGGVQFHHIENVPLLIISDLLLPHQLYWFHSIGQGVGQPGSSENGGGRSAGVRAGERLQRERRKEGLWSNTYMLLGIGYVLVFPQHFNQTFSHSRGQ